MIDGLNKLIPSSRQYVKPKVRDETARRISNRMFSIREVDQDVEASALDASAQLIHATSIDPDSIEQLPVGQIKIFVHDFSIATNGLDQGGFYDDITQDLSIKVTCGMIDPSTGIYRERKSSQALAIEEGPDLVNPVRLSADFQYETGCNFVQFEILNRRNRIVLSKIIELVDLPYDRFTTRRILAQAKSANSASTIEQSQMHLNVTFHLQHIQPQGIQVGGLQKTLAACYLRKKPLLVDIFDTSSDQSAMNRSFDGLVKSEYSTLSRLLSGDAALDSINEMYNHVQAGDYGKISLNDFQRII